MKEENTNVWCILFTILFTHHHWNHFLVNIFFSCRGTKICFIVAYDKIINTFISIGQCYSYLHRCAKKHLLFSFKEKLLEDAVSFFTLGKFTAVTLQLWPSAAPLIHCLVRTFQLNALSPCCKSHLQCWCLNAVCIIIQVHSCCASDILTVCC